MTLLTLVLILAVLWLCAMLFSPTQAGLMVLRILAGIAIGIYLLNLFGVIGRVNL